MAEMISMEQNCTNIFVHTDETEISEAFTTLWAQVINQKENQQIYVLQTDGSEL